MGVELWKGFQLMNTKYEAMGSIITSKEHNHVFSCPLNQAFVFDRSLADVCSDMKLDSFGPCPLMQSWRSFQPRLLLFRHHSPKTG